MDWHNIIYRCIETIIFGAIAGVVSGWIVNLLWEKREEKTRAYKVCETYLLSVLKEYDLNFPKEMLASSSMVCKNNVRCKKAIQKVLLMLDASLLENREYTEEENELIQNVMDALKELYSSNGKKRLFRREE